MSSVKNISPQLANYAAASPLRRKISRQFASVVQFLAFRCCQICYLDCCDTFFDWPMVPTVALVWHVKLIYRHQPIIWEKWAFASAEEFGGKMIPNIFRICRWILFSTEEFAKGSAFAFAFAFAVWCILYHASGWTSAGTALSYKERDFSICIVFLCV